MCFREALRFFVARGNAVALLVRETTLSLSCYPMGKVFSGGLGRVFTSADAGRGSFNIADGLDRTRWVHVLRKKFIGRNAICWNRNGDLPDWCETISSRKFNRLSVLT